MGMVYTTQWYISCVLSMYVHGTHIMSYRGRFWIGPPHFRAHFSKGNYVDTFFQVARFVQFVVSHASPFPTRAQTYTSRSALMRKHLTGFEALLGLVACRPNVFCRTDERGHKWCDSDVQLFICARFPRVIALPQSTSKAAAHDVEDIFVSIHACYACLPFQIFASDTSSRAKINDSLDTCSENVGKHGLPIGTTYKCLMQFDARELFLWKQNHGENSSACGMAAWQSWSINSHGNSRIAPCIRSALTCVILHQMFAPDVAWGMIKNYPRILRERARKHAKRGAKRRETGAKKKSVPLSLWFLSIVTVVACHAFSMKTISCTEGTAIGSCARGGMLFPFVPWEFFHPHLSSSCI